MWRDTGGSDHRSQTRKRQHRTDTNQPSYLFGYLGRNLVEAVANFAGSLTVFVMKCIIAEALAKPLTKSAFGVHRHGFTMSLYYMFLIA